MSKRFVAVDATMLCEHLAIAPPVRTALERNLPVVALETAILAHGMPYPENVATARAVETMVRERGATPATIGVIGGSIRIGLDADALEWLGTARGILKLSRADLPYAVAAREHGATTVAATMICAHLAGIKVLATGGIGGVHRGAETSFDVSADLQELGRTPVTVVCAGAKALLDLPKTLEVLETLGVPVIGYRTRDFPAFWSRSSGLAVPLRLDTPLAVVTLIRAKVALGVGGGVLLVNPIPAKAEIREHEIEVHIAAAIEEAKARGVSGKAVTPFLLDQIFLRTEGRSLAANIALIQNNAHLAAEVAIALAR